MQFHRIQITNFLSVGDPGISLSFGDLSGLVLIEGCNLDVSPTASNGAGKSLLMEAVIWALYGQTLRGLGKSDVVNNLNNKGCRVILEVDNFRVERGRKPNYLKFFEDPRREFKPETEKTLSKMPDTDRLIREKVGVDYTTFCNIFCFGQHNLFSFVSADEKTRREIVEDLLSLSDYNICLENTRTAHRTLKTEIKELIIRLEGLSKEIQTLEKTRADHLAAWERQRKKILEEIDRSREKLKTLEALDVQGLLSLWKAYDRAQGEMTKVKNEIHKLDSEIKIRKRQVKEKGSILSELDSKIEKIKSLNGGVRCDRCFGIIDPKNADGVLKDLMEKRAQCIQEAIKEADPLDSLNKAVEAARSHLKDLEAIPLPPKDKESLSKTQGQIDQLKILIEEKEKQGNEDPYKSVREELTRKIEELKVTAGELRGLIANKEEMVPYLEFWLEAFGPTGIRSFIVRNIVGCLNNQVNYWLQFLINNKIRVCFDEALEVQISRESGEPFDYKQGSGGEKRRIDLAISLAFADLMRISNNTHNSIIFLDEVVDSLDLDGINGVFALINQLSKNKTVFLITHNPSLLSQLGGVSRIKMIKEMGFSRLELS